MDPEVKKMIDDGIAAGMAQINIQITELKGSVGQFGEAATKIAEIQKNLDTVAQTVAGQKILGEDQVKALLAGELQTRETTAAEKAKASEATAAIKAKRDAFAAEKLKGVPSRLHGELGDDEAKWPELEKGIREKFAAELSEVGIKAPNVGGSAGGAAVEGSGSAGGFLKMPGAV